MEYKISEIVKEIKESIPEEVLQANRPGCNAKNISDILESEGLLYKSENGRRPTEYGICKGISEELRTNSEGREYYQVLYSERAKDMVRAIIFREYPDLDPERAITFSHRIFAPFAGRGINASRLIAEEYPGNIIIMFCGNDYRAFEDSAVNISQMLELQLFENARGVNSVIMKEEVLEDLVIPFLLKGDKSFIVNMEDVMHVYSAVRRAISSAITARPELRKEIKFGLCAEIENQNHYKEKVFLATREHSKTIEVHHGVGTVEVISVPITAMEGVRILSPNTELSRILVGSRENDSFTCNGDSYKILRVFRSETVNDRTIR